MSSNIDPALIQAGMSSNTPIGDPTLPVNLQGQMIGIESGIGFGVRASSLSQQDLQKQVMSGWGGTQRDTASDELFVGVSGTPIPGRRNEVQLDVSQAVMGEDAFNDMMEAWANDDKSTWEQIAEGLFMAPENFMTFTGPFEPEEIYEFENVRAAMLSAVTTASSYMKAGGGALGMAPTVDALLKSVDPEELQAKFDEVIDSKKSRNYSKETIIAAANRAAQTKLNKNATPEDLKAAIAAVHELSLANKTFDLNDELGAVMAANNPGRAAAVTDYENAKLLKGVIGNASLYPQRPRVSPGVELS
tara:strand:- start:729 stop:1640 length:912 start_codon:yes stop_codon:yes gene_type:complete